MTASKSKDSIYTNPIENIQDFKFDQKVVNVFDDMIKRSVPGYQYIVQMIGVLASQYVKENTCVYDLGCSLGAGSLAILSNVPHSNYNLVAVDNSPEMVKATESNFNRISNAVDKKIICSDIQSIDITNSSFIFLNFTLQFIQEDQRDFVINKIYNGLLNDGIFILSEKIEFEDKEENSFQINLHETFKKINGYSNLEVSQKRTALENVLIPEKFEKHKSRLQKAGFKKIYLWFQCFNFISIIAFK